MERDSSNFITKWFGKKNKPPTAQEGIQRLREVEEMLMKKSDFLEAEIDRELATAKKNGTRNKRVALQALKRKKRHEKQLNQIDGTLSTIELQREALEEATTNTEVLQVMNMSAVALRSAHDNMDVDKVHELMDEVADQQEVAKEIAEAISNPAGFGQDIDEDDLLAELEQLEEEELTDRLCTVDDGDSLSEEFPAVPTALPSKPHKPSATKEAEDDMEQLAAWAS